MRPRTPPPQSTSVQSQECIPVEAWPSSACSDAGAAPLSLAPGTRLHLIAEQASGAAVEAPAVPESAVVAGLCIEGSGGAQQQAPADVRRGVM